MLRSLHRRSRGRALAPLLSSLTGGRVPASAPAAPAPSPLPPAPERGVLDGPPPGSDEVWFRDHFYSAPDQVIEFLASGGLTLENRLVADIGSGDGIIDFGLALRGRPRRLVGYDINPTNVPRLLEHAQRFAGVEALPPNLEFEASQPEGIAVPDASFDVLITWSAFEHVGNPLALLREMRRIIRPDGALFLQLWPFYHSAQGSHLWDWFPEPYHHLVQSSEELQAAVLASDRHPREWADYMLAEFRELNQVTADELHKALVEAGFSLRLLELIGHRSHVPPGLDHVPLSVLAIGGVKLLAAPV